MSHLAHSLLTKIRVSNTWARAYGFGINSFQLIQGIGLLTTFVGSSGPPHLRSCPARNPRTKCPEALSDSNFTATFSGISDRRRHS